MRLTLQINSIGLPLKKAQDLLLIQKIGCSPFYVYCLSFCGQILEWAAHFRAYLKDKFLEEKVISIRRMIACMQQTRMDNTFLVDNHWPISGHWSSEWFCSLWNGNLIRPIKNRLFALSPLTEFMRVSFSSRNVLRNMDRWIMKFMSNNS